VYKEVCASKWSGTVPLRTHMSRWQLLGRLQHRNSYWADRVSELSCWRDPHCAYMYINIPSNGPPSCSVRGEQDEASGAVCVHVSALCVHL